MQVCHLMSWWPIFWDCQDMYAWEWFNSLDLYTANIKHALCGPWFCGFSLVDFDCGPGQHLALPEIHTRVWVGRLPQCQEPNFGKEGNWLQDSVPVNRAYFVATIIIIVILFKCGLLFSRFELLQCNFFMATSLHDNCIAFTEYSRYLMQPMNALNRHKSVGIKHKQSVSCSVQPPRAI